MSHLDLTGCKKRKRGEKVQPFKSSREHRYLVEFVGAFWENVKALLEFGHLESNLGIGMPCWSFQLEVHRHPLVHVLLVIVEESIDVTINHPCWQCQYDSIVAACLNSKGAGSVRVVGDSRNYNKITGPRHAWCISSNKFGHLLCVNGLEIGSDSAGCHILEFWDRLCTNLRIRKVSLSDISQKRGIDLRLIHSMAYDKL
ncbi:LOW QUALITY PROTEIN: hypothetical protein TorRG33x02_204390 [Trema orientale]|uniref:Uncharacterized protein n=1 Tax=Trema orientale TaxID=63057 RepID=A0A2P5EE04_TREOI|nr:LOW QUALITY PROTEIN: hypothetical protein TorRG33x02_204390 [Trema orientale]